MIKRTRTALFISIILLIATSIWAMPPKPGLYDSKTGLSKTKAAPLPSFARGVNAPGPQMQPTGIYDVLIILIEFADVAGTETTTSFDNMFNQANYNGTGSVNDYYQEVSYGIFGLNGTTVGWYSAAKNYSYYCNNDARLGTADDYGFGAYPNNVIKLVEEAVRAADPFVDFSQYDNDGDGVVDSLFIVHPEYGAEATGDPNDIWSHKWSLTDSGRPALIRDGVIVDAYAMAPEWSGESGSTHIEIGVFCHEYGHLLGLPDLYDTDFSSEGIGIFCLMAGGSWGGDGNSPETPVHMCAWAKAYLNWLTPIIVTADSINQAINQIGTNAEVYKVWTSGNPQKEYFLVSNREKTGFDKNLPGNGLLIWHIDENVIDAKMDTNTVNNDETRKGVDLEEADGLNHLDNRVNSGDAGDYFNSTNNNSFSNSTNPNSRSYAGSNTKVVITNISASGSVMYADIYVGGALDLEGEFGIEKAYNYPNPFVSKDHDYTTIRIELGTEIPPDDITIEIYDIAGELVHSVDSDDIIQSGKIYEYCWNGKNDHGKMVGSGVFICRIRVKGDGEEEVFFGKLAVVR